MKAWTPLGRLYKSIGVLNVHQKALPRLGQGLPSSVPRSCGVRPNFRSEAKRGIVEWAWLGFGGAPAPSAYNGATSSLNPKRCIIGAAAPSIHATCRSRSQEPRPAIKPIRSPTPLLRRACDALTSAAWPHPRCNRSTRGRTLRWRALARARSVRHQRIPLKSHCPARFPGVRSIP